MGHTLANWTDRVAVLVRDEGAKDLSTTQLEQAVRSAIAAYSIDQPRLVTVEKAGTGSSYVDIPTSGDGWVTDESAVVDIEFPARENPPKTLDRRAWRMVRKTTDVTIPQVLLLDKTPTASQWLRVTFSAPWPFPTSTAADDKIGDLAYEAVACLAASFALTQLAAQASRSRSGAIPSDFSDGRERARTLVTAADHYRDIYGRFVGKTADGEETSSSAPAHGYYDLDPTRTLIFHGGRR